MADSPVAKPARVLVLEAVDPQVPPLLRQLMEEIKGVQFKPEHVSSLDEAFERLEGSPFDVILVDLGFPGSMGLDSFLQLANRVTETPIVIADATDNPALALEVLRAGAQDYLVKSELDASHLRRALFFAIERQRTRALLQQLTFNDDLTGLLNRRGFLSLAQQQMKIARRENWSLILLFADLDGLKNINDTFGHPEGDRALRAVANILKETFRTSDLVARLGGDEFIVLAINAPAPGVKAITTRLQENIHRFNTQSRYYQISLSFGVVQFDPQQETSLEEIILKADKVLYENKRKKINLKSQANS